MRTSPDPPAAPFKNKSYFLELIVLFALEMSPQILAKHLKFLRPQTLTSPGPRVNSVFDSVSGTAAGGWPYLAHSGRFSFSQDLGAKLDKVGISCILGF